MKKMKPSVKVALASTLVVTSTAAIAYATSDIIGSKSSDNESKLALAIEKVDSDTVKVSIDNIIEVPKSLQFSIKLDGAEPKDENSIKDLVAKESEERLKNNEYATNSNNILTDYTYNKATNTIDVLITAENSIPKIGNKVDVFELDLKAKSASIFKKGEAPTYKIVPNEDVEYKYVSDTNKEYASNGVDYSKEPLTMNTAPTINDSSKYIEMVEGERIELTAEKLGVEIQDADGEEPKLEVKNGNTVIEEFTANKPGIYNLSVTAVDSYGERSETVTVQINVLKDTVTEKPTITRDGEALKDITINAGEIFEPMKGVTAVDAKGNSVEVNLKADKDLDLDPEVDTEYELTYTAKDIYDNTAEVTIKLTVKANKAPSIVGVKEHHILTVGDNFDPEAGVTVEDEDKDIELKVETNVDINTPGEYKILYSATDSGNKTTTIQSKVTVNPKMEEINSAPIITAEDKTIIVGTEFKPLEGVTVTDKEDSNLSVNDIKVESEVDVNKPGKYTVKYSVTDSQGATGTKTITVTVVHKMEGLNSIPVIIAEDKVIKLGETYDPLKGVTANDKEDGDLTKDIKYENNVDVNTEGEYTVTYTVVDSQGAKAVKTIKVTVKSDAILADSITINNKFDKLYTGGQKSLKATVNDEADIKDVEWTTSDENIASIEVIGNEAKVIAKSEGKVTITAKTIDGSNKSDTVTIDIVDLENEDKLPSFIKDIIDSNVVKPVTGIGLENSPLELEVQDIPVEKFEKFLKDLGDLELSLEEVYEAGNFTVYKIKFVRKARLFRSATEGYVEIRIDNSLVNANEYKASIDKLLANNLPEQPENPGQPEEPGQGGNTNQDQSGNGNNINNGGTTEDKKPSFGGIKLPATGQESILGYIGVAAMGIGGFLFGIKKKKK